MNNIPGTTNTDDSSSDPERLDPAVQEQLVLGFLTFYNSLEQALVRAGFTQTSSTPGSAQADWEMFARHIAERFDPLSKPELIGATAFLLWGEKNQALRTERLKTAPPWESARLNNDIVWISELIRQTGTKLNYGIHFNGTAEVDTGQLLSLMLVLQSWATLDAKVESLLGFVQ